MSRIDQALRRANAAAAVDEAVPTSESVHHVRERVAENPAPESPWDFGSHESQSVVAEPGPLSPPPSVETAPSSAAETLLQAFDENIA